MLIIVGTTMQGRMHDFRRGSPTFKILGFGYTCREAACCEQQSCEPFLEGFGDIPPRFFFLNDSISCVLRAVFGGAGRRVA